MLCIYAMLGGGVLTFWKDRANWLTVVSLALLASSSIIRIHDKTKISTVQTLLALSAPVVYIRFLFFAQVLRRQGLLIHVSDDHVCVASSTLAGAVFLYHLSVVLPLSRNRRLSRKKSCPTAPQDVAKLAPACKT